VTTPALKLDIGIFHFPYGGNGATSAESPDIREWEVETVLKMKADPRVGRIISRSISDTPITMTRNLAVKTARELGLHLVLFIDSDQHPNFHQNDPGYKPFWDVAFDAVYDHYGIGPLVIGAPYCGPAPAENVYVFQWDNHGIHGDETNINLSAYTRAQAWTMTGIQEVAALPTGMILYDMRAFELIEPCKLPQQTILEKLEAGQITANQAARMLQPGWFYYEWKDGYAAEKASTEDVSNTRDISLAGMAKLGYNPLRCAWDSWIGHHKPYCVGKPAQYTVEQIASNFRRAIEGGRSKYLTTFDVGNEIQAGIKRGDVLTLPPEKPQPVLSAADGRQ
jgi:hypothetical protein